MEPCRKFMIHNLIVDPPDEQMDEVITAKLAEIGFRLERPSVTIETSGLMPDSEARTDRRHWATFNVDRHTARAVREQKHGRQARIKELNTGLEDRPEKQLKLTQYKGMSFEAVARTLSFAAYILSKTTCPSEAGFCVTVVHRDTQHIQVDYDGTPSERITIESLIEDYRDIFEKAVRALKTNLQRLMRRMVERVEQKAEKRKIDERTLSIADTSSTATPLKRTRLSDSAFSSSPHEDVPLVMNLSPICV